MIRNRTVSFIGLFLIAIGSGVVRMHTVEPYKDELFACYEHLLLWIFGHSFAYFSGTIISVILTPSLRNIPCLDQGNCFSLAFGVPSAFMAVALGNKPGLRRE